MIETLFIQEVVKRFSLELVKQISMLNGKIEWEEKLSKDLTRQQKVKRN